MIMIKRISLAFALLVLPFIVFSQDQPQEDETKMVREIVTVMVDKSKFAAPTPPPAPVVREHGKKGKKKQVVEETAPPVADTGSSTIPAPSSEISKRVQNWLNSKNPKYTKTNASNTGST